MKTRLLTVFVATLWQSTVLVAAPPDDSGRAVVRLGSFSTMGGQIESRDIHVEIFELQNLSPKAPRTNLASRFKLGIASGIPFGIYRLRASALGFYPAERFVRVYAPEVWLIIGLEPGAEATPFPRRIVGEVKYQQDEYNSIWLKLTSVYSDFSMEAAVDTSGKFSFAGVPEGLYMLLTVCRDKVVDARPFSVPGDRSKLIIDISKSK